MRVNNGYAGYGHTDDLHDLILTILHILKRYFMAQKELAKLQFAPTPHFLLNQRPSCVMKNKHMFLRHHSAPLCRECRSDYAQAERYAKRYCTAQAIAVSPGNAIRWQRSPVEIAVILSQMMHTTDTIFLTTRIYRIKVNI